MDPLFLFHAFVLKDVCLLMDMDNLLPGSLQLARLCSHLAECGVHGDRGFYNPWDHILPFPLPAWAQRLLVEPGQQSAV